MTENLHQGKPIIIDMFSSQGQPYALIGKGVIIIIIIIIYNNNNT